MSDNSRSNPNPPINEKLPDGSRLIEERGDSFKVIEPDGIVSVQIQATPKNANKTYRVRYFVGSQEIYDKSGKTLARTSDWEMADHICGLLNMWKNIQDRKQSSGESPDGSKT